VWLKDDSTAYDKSKGNLYRTNSPYNILRIIKLAHALELKELHQVALEKLIGYHRKFYTQDTTQGSNDYQQRACDIYISLPYQVKNSILLKQVELFEKKLELSE